MLSRKARGYSSSLVMALVKHGTNQKNPANKITVDLDALLVGDILPILSAACDLGVLSTMLPMENELLPLFVEIRQFYNDPTKTITWALAFGVHAVLTSIMGVQGENCFRGLEEIVKVGFCSYMVQHQASVDQGATPALSKHLNKTMEELLRLLGLVESLLENVTPESMFKTYWNPMCAGTIMGYIAYFANLDCGLFMVDSLHQLRIVLHLFHGMVKCGALPPGTLPLLDLLHKKCQLQGCVGWTFT
jgi:hypothetical protein